ncbi:hypothetical protein [Paracoccus bogoriensis]|nr:hypothetical protein [Paracoccus bogoriensis]
MDPSLLMGQISVAERRRQAHGCAALADAARARYHPEPDARPKEA